MTRTSRIPFLKTINLQDIIVGVIFLAFSLLYFLGRLQPNFPNTILTGDGGNLVSYAAAQDRPDLFRGDPGMGETYLTGYYATIHMPLIRLLSRLTGGDYGYAFLLTLIPTAFIQLVGFYILGRVLFKNRFYAFLLAVLTSVPFTWNGLGEFWGIWPDPLPRVTFQAVLPYLMSLTIVWRNQPRRWPWLMVFAGLMVFLHSISTPAIGFAIWLGLILYLPHGWKFLKKLGVMLAMGLLFLLSMSPFLLIFLSYNVHASLPDYDLVMYVINNYQPPYLLNAPAAISLFTTDAIFGLLLPIGMAGVAILWRFGKVERPLVVMILTWFSAVILVSVGLPTMERLIETLFHRLPIDTELVRSMRYLVPLILIFWLWPLAEVSRRFTNRWWVRGTAVLGLILVSTWTLTHFTESNQMTRAVNCLTQGKFVCGNDPEFNQLVASLKQTPPGSRIFYFNESHAGVPLTLIIRYMALRPLLYSEIDKSLYLYTNNNYLEQWMEITRRIENIQRIPDTTVRMDQILLLTRDLQADYLVIDFHISSSELSPFPVEIIMQNQAFTLLNLFNP